jgi:hypothetical protein
MVRRRRTTGLVVLVLAAVVLAGVVGYQLGLAGPAPFEAQVVAVTSDGDGLCIDRPEDDCGQLLVSPGDRAKITPGVTVAVTEVWAQQDGGERLVFIVDVPE